jgi:hypothetical protein
MSWDWTWLLILDAGTLVAATLVILVLFVRNLWRE